MLWRYVLTLWQWCGGIRTAERLVCTQDILLRAKIGCFEMKSLTKYLASGALALALSGGVASAATFAFSNGGGNGTGTNLGAVGGYDFGLALTSNNNGTAGLFTTFTGVGAGAGENVSGDWNYATFAIGGSTFDALGYFIDDVFTALFQLSTDGIPFPAFQSGSFSFDVAGGQSYGFYMFANDGILGGANGTILGNLVPIPLPAGGLLLLGALGGLAVWRRRKTV